MLLLSCRVLPTRLASVALLPVGCFFFADSLARVMSWETESKEREAHCMWSLIPAGCRGSCFPIAIGEILFEKPLRAEADCGTLKRVCLGTRVLVHRFSQRPSDLDSGACCVFCMFAICLVSVKDSQPSHF